MIFANHFETAPVAEDEGFEPPQTESESGVLPLHKSSICYKPIILLFPDLSTAICQAYSTRTVLKTEKY